MLHCSPSRQQNRSLVDIRISEYQDIYQCKSHSFTCALHANLQTLSELPSLYTATYTLLTLQHRAYTPVTDQHQTSSRYLNIYSSNTLGSIDSDIDILGLTVILSFDLCIGTFLMELLNICYISPGL